jgi:C-terminal processing protease CtpA/Prc
MISPSRLNAAVAMLCLFALAGCASQPPLDTAAGRPEIIITNVDLEEIKAQLTTDALQWGYTTKSVTDYTAVYEKREQSTMAAVLMGSQYDPYPLWRLTYNLVEQNDRVRIVANIYIVTNPGSAFERISDVSQASKAAHSIQNYLEQLETSIEVNNAIYNRGEIGIGTNPSLEITHVEFGSPAQLAGLKIGDRILSIDGKPVANPFAVQSELTGKPGTVVVLAIERDGANRTIGVTRAD